MTEVSSVQELWLETTKIVDTTAATPAQQLLGGVNIRVDVAKTLKAVYLSAKLYLQGHAALVTGAITPWEFAKIAKTTWDLTITVLHAVRETMSELNYTACVVLSDAPDGMTEQRLLEEIADFLNSVRPNELPWYMGFTDGFVEEARKALTVPHAGRDVVAYLEKENWIRREGDTLIFKPRHMTWGFNVS